MRKCYVCGRKFRLLAKNRYEVVRKSVGLHCLTEGTVYYNAFDCPHCGCQNIVGVIEKANVKDFENEPQTEKADFIDIPEGATNGDMIKAMFPNVNGYLFVTQTPEQWQKFWNAPYVEEK